MPGDRFSVLRWRGWLLLGLAICGCDAAPPAPLADDAAPSVAHEQIAQGKISFRHDYDAACDEARRGGKPVLLFFTAPWCRFCNQMAQEAFVQDQVVALSERFVCILVDADQQTEVCREFGVRRFPTLQFLSPRGEPLAQIAGKRPGHQLVIEMQGALQATARRVDGTQELLQR